MEGFIIQYGFYNHGLQILSDYRKDCSRQTYRATRLLLCSVENDRLATQPWLRVKSRMMISNDDMWSGSLAIALLTAARSG